MSVRTHVDLRTAFRTSTVLRSRDLTALGISRVQIADSTKRGVIQRIGRGLYTIENAKITEKHSYVQVAKMVPHGVLCLLSACRIHGITTQNPRDVWFALEPKAWAPKITFVRTRLQRFSGPAFSEGIETIRCEGMDLRVYSVAKTVVDLFRLRNKIGLDIALEALRDVLKQKKCTTRELMHFARLRHVAKVIEPYLTAYTAS